jgi:hypothetical protein
MNRLHNKRQHLMIDAFNTYNQSGKGLVVNNINIYNPKNKPINDEMIKTIINNKNYLIFHITGSIEPIKKLLGTVKIETSRVKEGLVEGFYWYSMPQYKADDKIYPIIYVGFINNVDKNDFAKKLNINIGGNKWVHYPKPIIPNNKKMKYEITYKINPKYPVYIISKGRWKSRYTSKSLEEANIPYHIVVEKEEYEKYAEVIDERKILILPKKYLEVKGHGGPVPARNFVWDDAIRRGFKKHWVLDDNIDGFYRWNLNSRFKIKSGVLFKLCEDYVDRFTRILHAGMNYHMFYPDRQPKAPVVFNTRVYSCHLIDHRMDKIIGNRWRGVYNDDTDMSLQVLKAGWGTCLFNAFLCGKKATLVVRGGLTDSIYKRGDKGALLKKAQALVDRHPDVAKVVKRYKRGIHHQVDYSGFKNNDVGYKNPKINRKNKEYNMRLVKYDS